MTIDSRGVQSLYSVVELTRKMISGCHAATFDTTNAIVNQNITDIMMVAGSWCVMSLHSVLVYMPQ
jgi:hypothetical protein